MILTFEGLCRPGETLNAERSDLLLPEDLFAEDPHVAFLRIRKPKGRTRGLGVVQHSKISGELVVRFLSRVFGRLHQSNPLYPGSPSSFRTRWDTILILSMLGVEASLGLTPASMRGGGAVRFYRNSGNITQLLWHMRIKNIETLQHYLQEVGAEAVLTQLSFSSRTSVKAASSLFEACLIANLF